MRQEASTALGERLRVLRRARALTQSSLARLAGISRQYLSDIERSTVEPSAEVLAAIATALGIRVEELSQDTKTNDHQ
jgi:transcriptional regulator with XRE-family HTH domain